MSDSPLLPAVPPVISSRGGTVTVVVNEAARLRCEANGVPPPGLTWLKDGSPVASVSHGIQVWIETCCIKLKRIVNEIKYSLNVSQYCSVGLVAVFLCVCVFLPGVVGGQNAVSNQCTGE